MEENVVQSFSNDPSGESLVVQYQIRCSGLCSLSEKTYHSEADDEKAAHPQSSGHRDGLICGFPVKRRREAESLELIKTGTTRM